MIRLISSSFGISSSFCFFIDYFLKISSSLFFLSYSVDCMLYRPASISVSTIFFFYVAFDRIFSSMVPLQTNLNTRTSFVVPILCALSWACSSILGFQSESNKMTVSAVCRLSPSPPALVLRMKTGKSELGLLNSAILSARCSSLVDPSKIKCLIPLNDKKTFSNLMTEVICVNIRILWFVYRSLGSILSRSSNLPEQRIMSSPSW